MREVRWFRAGPTPEAVLNWFTSATAKVEREQRTDWYDADFTHDGVGVKRRGASTIETKVRVTATSGVDLAPGMTGNVEDWIKTSAPDSDSADDRGHHHLAVSKDIVSRRSAGPGGAFSGAGCEAELVGLTVGGHIAWSLCFETFGRPEDRFAAFDAGIRRFLADTPLPDGVAFAADESRGYPAWIGGLDQPT